MSKALTRPPGLATHTTCSVATRLWRIGGCRFAVHRVARSATLTETTRPSVHPARTNTLFARSFSRTATGEVTAAGLDSSQIYFTDSGREVYGGGGITPDLIVRPEAATDEEDLFFASLGEQQVAYSDAMFRFAVAYADSHPELKPDFEVTQHMLDEFFAWLEDTGLEVDRALYDGARRIVTRSLAIQLATVAFDEEDATRRRMVLDRQLDTAVELLREGRTQAELFSLAKERQGDDVAMAQEQ